MQCNAQAGRNIYTVKQLQTSVRLRSLWRRLQTIPHTTEAPTRKKSARYQNTQNEFGQILNNIKAMLLTLQTKYDGAYVPYEKNNAKP